MHYLLSFLLILLTATFTCADVPPEQQPEVRHLISFVQSSPCLIRRNGKTHSGKEAASHIREKYDYFRDRIRTTEDFIKYSASKSTMSGKYYTVLCEGRKPMRTIDWLLKELKSYRRERRK
mgnify:CR=1 FL=1